MFLEKSDYKSLSDADDLEVLQNSDNTQRVQAEETAQEIISGYIRSRYDVVAIFTATGSVRNKMMIMLMIDITLYNLSATIPGRLTSENLQIRFDNAKSFLKDIQNGKMDLNLPAKDAVDSGNPIRFGSNSKQNNEW